MGYKPYIIIYSWRITGGVLTGAGCTGTATVYGTALDIHIHRCGRGWKDKNMEMRLHLIGRQHL